MFRLDFSELAFTLLGVDSKECRKRFICEMSVNYRRNPILGSAYKMISRQFFPSYIDNESKSLKECAVKHSACGGGPSDPIPEDNNNAVEESVNSKAGIQSDEEARALVAKPQLDQVQRFVVGAKSL